MVDPEVPVGDDGGVNEPQKEKLPTAKQMNALLRILVTLLNGITIDEKTLDEYPDDAKINITFDEDTKTWSMWCEKDDSPKIITPGLVKPKKRTRRPIQLPGAGDRRRMFGG